MAKLYMGNAPLDNALIEVLVDDAPVEGSNRAVSSGGVYNAIKENSDKKQDKISISGVIVGDGNGNLISGVAGEDFAAPDHKHTVSDITDFPEISGSNNENCVSKDQLGVANGVATLDKSGKLSSSQLPETFYIGADQPTNEKVIWIDTAENVLKYCVGGKWIALGAVYN